MHLNQNKKNKKLKKIFINLVKKIWKPNRDIKLLVIGLCLKTSDMLSMWLGKRVDIVISIIG